MDMSNEVSHVVAMNLLGWETLEAQRKKNKAKLMFKVLNNLGPQSLTDLFFNKRDITNYNLREVSSSDSTAKNACVKLTHRVLR